MSSFESLITEKGYKYNDRWHPYNVEKMDKILGDGLLKDMPINKRKNIVYSLQYLQYLELQINELKLHSVIETMVYKNYVITGMSIIESIFYYLVKLNGKWRMITWKQESDRKTNVFKGEDGIERVIHVITEKKLDTPEADEMNFDAVINKVQDMKLFDSSDFPLIKQYKRMRNRVHLQIGEENTDTDYFNFGKKDYLCAKYLLYTVLSNPNICDDIDDVNFLKMSKEDINSAKNY